MQRSLPKFLTRITSLLISAFSYLKTEYVMSHNAFAVSRIDIIKCGGAPMGRISVEVL